jgi:hypothetical protein
MHPILADSLLTGLFVCLFALFSMLCTVVAFTAIVPAALGRLRLAIFMALPAFVCCILNIVIIGFFLYSDAPPRDMLQVYWKNNDLTFELICFSAIPFALSLFVLLLAFVCSQKKKRFAK